LAEVSRSKEVIRPIVAIVGRPNSGKTTLIEKLIPELKSRGYRVAAIKHTSHSLEFDRPGKDSWRYTQAGSDAVAIVSPDRVVLIRPHRGDVGLEQVAQLVGNDCDIVLAEGFKQSGVPKIEVHRKEIGPLLSSLVNLIAIVSDEPLDTSIRQFPQDDRKGLADFLETTFLRKTGR